MLQTIRSLHWIQILQSSQTLQNFRWHQMSQTIL
jgi:hypothetical protein